MEEMTTSTTEPSPPAPAEVRNEGEALIRVSGLRKHYGPIKAVDGIDFEVHRGDILGFLGPNGAGKTTAMRLITGFLEPDSGSVEVCGHDMATDSLAARQRIGYLPENAPAYGEMTVYGFLEFVAKARGVAEIERAIAKVLVSADLERVRHQTVETLSKGYKRRVGLAQALIHDPEVLILDEPTDGLDPNQKAVVQELIASLSKDKCIVLSTHILDEVERICTRAIIVSEGRVLVDSTPRALVEQAPEHNVVRLVLKEEHPALHAALEASDWCERVVQSHEAIGPVLEIHPRDGHNRLPEILAATEGIPLESVHQREGRLDDLFRQLTEGASR